jgi:hypothetical protein
MHKWMVMIAVWHRDKQGWCVYETTEKINGFVKWLNIAWLNGAKLKTDSVHRHNYIILFFQM